jgi:DNA invertase Pin-like site-specific DNA recombinase
MTPTAHSPKVETKGKAIVYLRISKEDRRGAKVTASIEAQRERAEIYCASNGLEIVEVVVDEGVSAEVDFFERKGGKRVLALLRASEPKASTLRKGQRLGAPSHLVVAKQDRICRSVNDLTTWLPQADEAGITLHLTEEGGAQDPSDPHQMMVLQMKATMSEAERKAISIRTKALMGWHGRQGRYLGHVPYGYRLAADGKTLEVEPSETAALEIIRKSTAKLDQILEQRDAIDRQLLEMQDKYRAEWRAAMAKAGAILGVEFTDEQIEQVPTHAVDATFRLSALFAAHDFSDEQLASYNSEEGEGIERLEDFEKNWRKLQMIERTLEATIDALDRARRDLRKARLELTKAKKSEGSQNLARRLKALGKKAPPRSVWSAATVDSIRDRFRMEKTA